MHHLLDLFLSNDKYSRVCVLLLDCALPMELQGGAEQSKLQTFTSQTDFEACLGALDTAARGSSAALVYSGSALLLTAASAPEGLRALSALVARMDGLLASLTLFHTSVHSAMQLSKLSCLFANTVDVTPNPGAVTADCMALCRTIRTARSSAKRAQETEEFLARREALSSSNGNGNGNGNGWTSLYRFAVLGPIKGSARGVGGSGFGGNHEEEAGMAMGANSFTAGVSSDTTAAAANAPISRSKALSATATAVTVPAAPASNPNLVVFDKGDPEWDEDSDPDGDLDL
jgi:hypothetical protein